MRVTGGGRGRWVRRHAWTLAVYLVLALMLIYERIIHETAFGAFDMQSLVDQTTPLALIAIAQSIVVIAGGIDLAVGPLMGLASVMAASLMGNVGLGGALGISLLVLAGGAAAGALTGLAITITRVPDIIVTLATSFIWGGVALQRMPTPGGGAPLDFAGLLIGGVGSSGFPVGLLVVAIAALVIWLPVRLTRPGLAIYALGSNRTAAFLSGVNVTSTRVTAYALGGIFAALGGLVLTASTLNGSATSASASAPYTLNSVAAIVIGGVALTGGRGGVMGPIAAAFILSLLSTILGFLNVDPNYSQVIQGVISVLAVMIGGLLLRKRG